MERRRWVALFVIVVIALLAAVAVAVGQADQRTHEQQPIADGVSVTEPQTPVDLATTESAQRIAVAFLEKVAELQAEPAPSPEFEEAHSEGSVGLTPARGATTVLSAAVDGRRVSIGVSDEGQRVVRFRDLAATSGGRSDPARVPREASEARALEFVAALRPEAAPALRLRFQGTTEAGHTDYYFERVVDGVPTNEGTFVTLDSYGRLVAWVSPEWFIDPGDVAESLSRKLDVSEVRARLERQGVAEPGEARLIYRCDLVVTDPRDQVDRQVRVGLFYEFGTPATLLVDAGTGQVVETYALDGPPE